jgi:MinD-like ATPase involved in chromosome partitioning or flagellar assembly
MTVIAVRAAKGGVGRSSLTVLLALALTRRGGTVSVLDLDRQDAVRLLCGDVTARPRLPESSRFELALTPGGFTRVAQDAGTCGLLMGGGPMALRRAPDLLAPWLGRREMLLVDMPADEDAVAAAVGTLAGLHLRIFTPDLGALAQLANPDEDAAFNRSMFVLNKADLRRPLTESAAAFLRHVAGARFAGEVRRDEAAPEAFAALELLPDYEPASAAWHDIDRLAAEIELRCAPAIRYEGGSLDDEPRLARRA